MKTAFKYHWAVSWLSDFNPFISKEIDDIISEIKNSAAALHH